MTNEVPCLVFAWFLLLRNDRLQLFRSQHSITVRELSAGEITAVFAVAVASALPDPSDTGAP